MTAIPYWQGAQGPEEVCRVQQLRVRTGIGPVAVQNPITRAPRQPTRSTGRSARRTTPAARAVKGKGDEKQPEKPKPNPKPTGRPRNEKQRQYMQKMKDEGKWLSEEKRQAVWQLYMNIAKGKSKQSFEDDKKGMNMAEWRLLFIKFRLF